MKHKYISGILAVFLVVWLGIFAAGMIPYTIFWVVVLCAAVYAFVVLPRRK